MSSTAQDAPATETLMVRSLDRPQESRPTADRGRIDLVTLGHTTIGRATFEPGWRWSEHVKPMARTESCQVTHTGYVVSGRQAVRMDDGSEAELGPGDAFRIGPGHDAWVVGDEPCVTVDFSGGASFARTRPPGSGYVSKAIDEMESIHQGLVKLAGDELGVESFGMQVLDVPPGFSHYPEHDHAHDGQEEVYVVLQGEAEFAIDGERLTLSAGQMLRVQPGSRRRLDPGPEGVRILALGSTPGADYERPADFRLGTRA